MFHQAYRDVQEFGVRPAKDSRDALHVVAGPLDDSQGEAVHVCDPAVRRDGENGWDLRRLTALLERARAGGPVGQDEPFELRMTLGKRVLCPKESSAGPLSPPPPQHRLPTTPDTHTRPPRPQNQTPPPTAPKTANPSEQRPPPAPRPRKRKRQLGSRAAKITGDEDEDDDAIYDPRAPAMARSKPKTQQQPTDTAGSFSLPPPQHRLSETPSTPPPPPLAQNQGPPPLLPPPSPPPAPKTTSPSEQRPHPLPRRMEADTSSAERRASAPPSLRDHLMKVLRQKGIPGGRWKHHVAYEGLHFTVEDEGDGKRFIVTARDGGRPDTLWARALCIRAERGWDTNRLTAVLKAIREGVAETDDRFETVTVEVDGKVQRVLQLSPAGLSTFQPPHPTSLPPGRPSGVGPPSAKPPEERFAPDVPLSPPDTHHEQRGDASQPTGQTDGLTGEALVRALLRRVGPHSPFMGRGGVGISWNRTNGEFAIYVSRRSDVKIGQEGLKVSLDGPREDIIKTFELAVERRNALHRTFLGDQATFINLTRGEVEEQQGGQGGRHHHTRRTARYLSPESPLSPPGTRHQSLQRPGATQLSRMVAARQMARQLGGAGLDGLTGEALARALLRRLGPAEHFRGRGGVGLTWNYSTEKFEAYIAAGAGAQIGKRGFKVTDMSSRSDIIDAAQQALAYRNALHREHFGDQAVLIDASRLTRAKEREEQGLSSTNEPETGASVRRHRRGRPARRPVDQRTASRGKEFAAALVVRLKEELQEKGVVFPRGTGGLGVYWQYNAFQSGLWRDARTHKLFHITDFTSRSAIIDALRMAIQHRNAAHRAYHRERAVIIDTAWLDGLQEEEDEGGKEQEQPMTDASDGIGSLSPPRAAKTAKTSKRNTRLSDKMQLSPAHGRRDTDLDLGELDEGDLAASLVRRMREEHPQLADGNSEGYGLCWSSGSFRVFVRSPYEDGRQYVLDVPVAEPPSQQHILAAFRQAVQQRNQLHSTHLGKDSVPLSIGWLDDNMPLSIRLPRHRRHSSTRRRGMMQDDQQPDHCPHGVKRPHDGSEKRGRQSVRPPLSEEDGLALASLLVRQAKKQLNGDADSIGLEWRPHERQFVAYRSEDDTGRRAERVFPVADMTSRQQLLMAFAQACQHFNSILRAHHGEGATIDLRHINLRQAADEGHRKGMGPPVKSRRRRSGGPVKERGPPAFDGDGGVDGRNSISTHQRTGLSGLSGSALANALIDRAREQHQTKGRLCMVWVRSVRDFAAFVNGTYHQLTTVANLDSNDDIIRAFREAVEKRNGLWQSRFGDHATPVDISWLDGEELGSDRDEALDGQREVGHCSTDPMRPSEVEELGRRLVRRISQEQPEVHPRNGRGGVGVSFSSSKRSTYGFHAQMNRGNRGFLSGYFGLHRVVSRADIIDAFRRCVQRRNEIYKAALGRRAAMIDISWLDSDKEWPDDHLPASRPPIRMRPRDIPSVQPRRDLHPSPASKRNIFGGKRSREKTRLSGLTDEALARALLERLTQEQPSDFSTYGRGGRGIFWNRSNRAFQTYLCDHRTDVRIKSFKPTDMASPEDIIKTFERAVHRRNALHRSLLGDQATTLDISWLRQAGPSARDESFDDSPPRKHRHRDAEASSGPSAPPYGRSARPHGLPHSPAAHQSDVVGVCWYEQDQAWMAHWSEKGGGQKSKYFYISEHGFNKAKALAEHHRREMERTGRAGQKVRSQHQSGVRGVTFNQGNNMWLARWQQGGQRKARRFSVAQLGYNGAMQAAIQALERGRRASAAGADDADGSDGHGLSSDEDRFDGASPAHRDERGLDGNYWSSHRNAPQRRPARVPARGVRGRGMPQVALQSAHAFARSLLQRARQEREDGFRKYGSGGLGLTWYCGAFAAYFSNTAQQELFKIADLSSRGAIIDAFRRAVTHRNRLHRDKLGDRATVVKLDWLHQLQGEEETMGDDPPLATPRLKRHKRLTPSPEGRQMDTSDDDDDDRVLPPMTRRGRRGSGGGPVGGRDVVDLSGLEGKRLALALLQRIREQQLGGVRTCGSGGLGITWNKASRSFCTYYSSQATTSGRRFIVSDINSRCEVFEALHQAIQHRNAFFGSQLGDRAVMIDASWLKRIQEEEEEAEGDDAMHEPPRDDHQDSSSSSSSSEDNMRPTPKRLKSDKRRPEKQQPSPPPKAANEVVQQPPLTGPPLTPAQLTELHRIFHNKLERFADSKHSRALCLRLRREQAGQGLMRVAIELVIPGTAAVETFPLSAPTEQAMEAAIDAAWARRREREDMEDGDDQEQEWTQADRLAFCRLFATVGNDAGEILAAFPNRSITAIKTFLRKEVPVIVGRGDDEGTLEAAKRFVARLDAERGPKPPAPKKASKPPSRGSGDMGASMSSRDPQVPQRQRDPNMGSGRGGSVVGDAVKEGQGGGGGGGGGKGVAFDALTREQLVELLKADPRPDMQHVADKIEALDITSAVSLLDMLENIGSVDACEDIRRELGLQKGIALVIISQLRSFLRSLKRQQSIQWPPGGGGGGGQREGGHPAARSWDSADLVSAIEEQMGRMTDDKKQRHGDRLHEVIKRTKELHISGSSMLLMVEPPQDSDASEEAMVEAKMIDAAREVIFKGIGDFAVIRSFIRRVLNPQ
ncbi:unnamed protein product [Vitrella brassicaformis CCMP3155]|uniref:AP2/ERF domain-containing protein n=3 Tax=Vitrella brassicaformis TaxID=1169539 RepID=A0A0G4GWM4_VITBC|nr:unnamed protein product [Vitrella brassicaformis CCMP3155]|eukprot:CEM35342.1 unnamed protein product [Vitrella brassicaformis CCMP3155]